MGLISATLNTAFGDISILPPYQYRHLALLCTWEDPAFLMGYPNSCEQNHCFCISPPLYACESDAEKVSNAIELIKFDVIFVEVRNETIRVGLS